LLSKPSRRRVEVPVGYMGFEIPDAYVYGYGLDRAHYDRNIAFISSVKTS
jgi:hypoxanthine phosphoribosyltransferase